MRRPAGVPDPDLPLDRFFFKPFGKIIELALNPPSLDPPIDQGRDARRIIASIFETP